MFNGGLKKEVQKLAGRVQQLEKTVFQLTHKQLPVEDLSAVTVALKKPVITHKTCGYCHKNFAARGIAVHRTLVHKKAKTQETPKAIVVKKRGKNVHTAEYWAKYPERLEKKTAKAFVA